MDECDEEGWLMGINAEGQKGYIPQNYVEFSGQQQQPQEEYQQQQQQQPEAYEGSLDRQDSYGQQDYYGSGQASNASSQDGYYR